MNEYKYLFPRKRIFRHYKKAYLYYYNAKDTNKDSIYIFLQI